MPTDPASPKAVGFAVRGRPQPHVSQVLQPRPYCPASVHARQPRKRWAAPEIGAPAIASRLTNPNWISIRASVLIPAAGRQRRRQFLRDRRSGSHTSSQPPTPTRQPSQTPDPEIRPSVRSSSMRCRAHSIDPPAVDAHKFHCTLKSVTFGMRHQTGVISCVRRAMIGTLACLDTAAHPGYGRHRRLHGAKRIRTFFGSEGTLVTPKSGADDPEPPSNPRWWSTKLAR